MEDSDVPGSREPLTLHVSFDVPLTLTARCRDGIHVGVGSVMKARYSETSANTDGVWSAPQRSLPHDTTPSSTGADAKPVTSGPPLSPKQPELSGCLPSGSIEQRMR